MDGLASSPPGARGAAGAPAPAPSVVVLAASNLPWELDEAFRRRFEKRIYLPLPDEGERAALFEVTLRGIATAGDVAPRELAALTPGFSGADILTLTRTAALMPIRRVLEAARSAGGGGVEALRAALAAQGITQEDATALALPVERAHFISALAGSKPSVRAEDAARCEAWMADYGSV